MATTTHPSILRAQEIYDLPGDLNRDQQTFLTAVHSLTMECARTKGRAVEDWGDGSRAYHAVAYLAERHLADQLAAALNRYEASLEDRDTEAFPFELAAE